MSLLSLINRGRTSRAEQADEPNDSGEIALEARRRWELVVASVPDDAEARLQLAHTYEALGDEEALGRLIEELDERFSTNRPLRILVARHYLRRGDNELALARWSAIEADYPDQSESAINLAYLYFREDRLDEALAFSDVLADKHGLAGRANKIRAKVYQRREAWDDAVVAWRGVLAEHSDDGEALAGLIGAHLKKDDMASAQAELTAAREADPENPALLGLQFRILMRGERFEEALQVLGQQLESRPTATEILYEKAAVLYRLDRHEESESICRKMLECKPEDVRILTLYARIGQARLSALKTA